MPLLFAVLVREFFHEPAPHAGREPLDLVNRFERPLAVAEEKCFLQDQVFLEFGKKKFSLMGSCTSNSLSHSGHSNSTMVSTPHVTASISLR